MANSGLEPDAGNEADLPEAGDEHSGGDRGVVPPNRHGLITRYAGRVVLLDPDDRVLLMRYDDGLPNGVHWSTPGGGLNPGEDYPTGAARELAEETGWHDIVLGGEVHRRTNVMEHNDVVLCQVERFYVARTDQPSREITGVDAMHASDGIAAWRWWTRAELVSTTEAIWPRELADLVMSAALRQTPSSPS